MHTAHCSFHGGGYGLTYVPKILEIPRSGCEVCLTIYPSDYESKRKWKKAKRRLHKKQIKHEEEWNKTKSQDAKFEKDF